MPDPVKRHNIAAYTEPTPTMPGYVSINKEENGSVTVTVRGADGAFASVAMEQVQFDLFLAQCNKYNAP